MKEPFSFPHYLLAKQSVDDRALNKDVLAELRRRLTEFSSLNLLEIGAGIGSMLIRLLRWEMLPPLTEYTLLDEMSENIAFARTWIPQAARELGWQAGPLPDGGLRLTRARQVLTLHFVQESVFDFCGAANRSAFDVLVAHAVLDLFPMPGSLPPLFSLLKPGGLAWFTINFDGVSSLEPTLDPALDALVESLYHQTMDERPGGGDSQSGRHLFGHLRQFSAEILAAGASDWVVYPTQGGYPADEAYFLACILHFFEESLAQHPALTGVDFPGWLAARRAQVERGELVYIAHQMDFLCRANL
ncbi:MAG: class I SAM-dependent methyltransferase [Anaerolineales bacterium]